MALIIYNTLSRKKEVFKPRKSPQVGMYICGPTVYGPGHIGHARTYISFDIIRRYLEYKGFKVRFIMNITDIHDDVIKEAKRLKVPFSILAERYSKLFLKEINELGIKRANYYPRVTKNIQEIIKFIKNLVKRDYGYQANRSVYFDISKFKDYGKLSRVKLKKALTGTRIKTDKYEKEEVSDFALWKEAKPGEPNWPSPWGRGRPGWHIECSVMSQKYLGKQIDIHGGAKDLIFPHHENEIAQSEALTSLKPFANYWLHSGLLTVRGQKMAKSLGNYITVEKALKNWPAQVIRLFVGSSHYRSPQDYNVKSLLQAKKGIKRIDELVEKLKALRGRSRKNSRGHKKSFVKGLILQTEREFEKAMDDDFNMPKALASVFRMINLANQLLDKDRLSRTEAKEILNFLKKVDKIFNFIFWGKEKLKIPALIMKMVKEREVARKRKNWKKADEIRREIKRMGYWVEDTKEGSKIKKS